MLTGIVNIGFGNVVMTGRIIAVVSPESAPIKRIISDARQDKLLIDATYGRRTRSVVIMDDGHVLLSAVQPETVAMRSVLEPTEPDKIEGQSTKVNKKIRGAKS